MIEYINDKLEEIDHHLDNIKELVPGCSDLGAALMLGAISAAECSLRIAHSYMVDPSTIKRGEEDRWEI